MPKISVRNGNGRRARARRNTTRTTRCCRKPTARSPICAANCPTPRTTVNGREDILKSFATCPDSQRSWLLLEDYFEKLSLSRRDFPDTNWWPRLLNAPGQGAPGGTGVFVSARQAFRAAGIAAARQPRTVLPGPRRPSRNSSSSRNWKTGSRRPRCRCSTRRAPRSASSAACSRTRRSRRATGSPCNFFCRARAPAKRRARCTS